MICALAGLRMTPAISTLELDDAVLRTATWGTEPPTLVLLHDGLGSLEQWRDFPGRLAEATSRTVLAYERPGHGRSTPTPAGAWPVDFFDVEAQRLQRLLDHLGLESPLLVGLSDGGTIALLHAATWPGRARAVAALASHSWVEDVCVETIEGMRRRRESVVKGLSLYHEAPEVLFDAWSGVWTSPSFRARDLRPRLASIVVPTLIAQGSEDEYATDAMLRETAAAIGDAQALELSGLGHLLHVSDPDRVAAAVADFFASLD